MRVGRSSKFFMFHRMRIKYFYQVWKLRADMAFSHTQATQGLVVLRSCGLFLELGSEFNHGIEFEGNPK